MEQVSYGIGVVLAVAFLALFSQIYFWRRKTRQMADNELRKSDPEEWKRHLKFSSYVKLVSRIIWGGIFLSMSVAYMINTSKRDYYVANGLTAMMGLIFVAWAIWGYRYDRSVISKVT
jgi:uncharacterized membrane protein YfcA